MEFDASYDYLTATFRCHKEWEDAIDKINVAIHVVGKRRPWRFLQYEGTTAVSSHGHLAVGYSAHSSIIQAGGEVANQLVTRADLWRPAEMRVTRLDFACTFNLEGSSQLVRQLMGDQRPEWRCIIPHEEKGGGTLYVGSRSSDAFGRLYDKGALLNTQLPGTRQIPIAQLWRAEIEYKAKRARAAWEASQALANGVARRTFIADTVLTWFQNHGVYLPIMPTSPSIVSVASRACDDIRTIKWFHEQVRPAILRVSENGLEKEALAALGLGVAISALAEVRWVGEGPLQFSFFDKIGEPE